MDKIKALLACRCVEKCRDWAPFVLRVAVGFVFFKHGLQKLEGNFFPGFLTSLGVPAPMFFAPLISWIEFLGGIALILGIGTHWAAKLLSIDMIMAIILVHWNNGFFVEKGGMELALILLAGNIALMMWGAGSFALDRVFFKKGKY